MKLIIIFSPLQFLNALRYISKNDGKFKIIVLTPKKTNIDQIKKLDINKHCHFPFYNLIFLQSDVLWFIQILYVNFLVSVNKFQTIAVGNYNNILAYTLACRFAKKNRCIHILDDGLSTLKIYDDRNIKGKLINQNLHGGRLKNLYIKILKLSTYSIKSVEFHTTYNLEFIALPRYDNVIYNKYSFDLKPTKINENEVWFIGQPLVQLNILSLKEFNKVILDVLEQCANDRKKFTYIAHRFGKNDVSDYKVIKFDKPIEIVFKELNVLPAKVISFYSSAIINLSETYKDIDFRYIDIEHLISKNESISSVYNYFKASGNIRKYES